MSIITDNFMLHGDTAKALYKKFAEPMPVIDYHCHISPELIAKDYKFKSITELMLGGDHYKWRMMRSNGVDEKYMTGDADDYEKFLAFAKSLPRAIGNPLYHWTHLELKRYFGIDECLNEKTCRSIYDRCNELLKRDEYSVRGLIKRYNVKAICTTDDPLDSLEWHKKIKEDGFETKVYPTFRPDKAVNIDKDTFMPYLEQMGVASFDEFCKVLIEKIDYFKENGCRLSDHALEYVPYEEGDAETVFNKKLAGEALSQKEVDVFKTFVLRMCAKKYAEYDWAMQVHIGALRNNNTRMFEKLGPDTGFDSINDLCIAEKLSMLLNSLEYENKLPKTILYTLNPKDNYTLGTMLGNFQGSGIRGKIQFGSGWWFNDQRDGMVEQMKSLANLGVLGNFVGMLTDSRSFVSYTRHEYFRRILCNLIGNWVDNGEYPYDEEMLGEIVRGISYENAVSYFKFDGVNL